MRVTFKVQHGVDHVFEHTRPGQRAFFGDMADQHNGRAAGLGQASQMRGAFAYLRDRPGCAGELVRVHGLYRINHRDMRRLRLQGADDFFQLGFGQHVHPAVVQTQPACTQCHLRAGFFAGDIQGALAAALQTVERLQQQSGFANARVATDQDHAAFDHAAAQYAV